MSLIRYNSNYDDFFPTFNNLFGKFFSDGLDTTADKARFVPNVDVLEKDKTFELHVAVPGMKKEDFTIDLTDNLLVVSGERKLKEEKKEGKYYSFETNYGSFKRSFRIPKNVDQTKVEATYEDGILHIELPKLKDSVVKNVIKIK